MAPKNFADDDPMELNGVVLPGEPGQLEAMAECLIEEYIRLGWGEQRLLTLFVNPMFLATHRIYQQKGETYVRALIQRTQAKWGVGATGSAYQFPKPIFEPPSNCSLT